jgi:hypothetical protein
MTLSGAVYAFMSYLLSYFSRKYRRYIDRSTIHAHINITRGDKLAIDKIYKNNKTNRNKALGFIASCFVAAAVNIGSSYIYEILK